MCLGGAVIDLKTGEVVQPPLARPVRGEEHWIFCASMFENGGTEYHRESSLFVLRCGGKADQNGNTTPDTYYSNFVGDSSGSSFIFSERVSLDCENEDQA
jgi:hypothetical protein